jgi:hypothetical protein
MRRRSRDSGPAASVVSITLLPMANTHETDSALLELHPRGCVIVRARKGVTQTLDHARENVKQSVELAGGQRLLPLLVDITQTAPLTSEVRHYYVGGALAENFTALGIVTEASPFGRMMGNVFFRMMAHANRRDARTSIPTRLFGDEEGALSWLTSHRR